MANPQMPAEEMARKVEFIETKLNGTAHAIIPCIDLPMHVHPDTINEVPMAILGAEKGVFTLASERDTKAGQEWVHKYRCTCRCTCTCTSKKGFLAVRFKFYNGVLLSIVATINGRF